METNRNDPAKSKLIADLEQALDNYVQEWKLNAVKLSSGLENMATFEKFPSEVFQKVTEPQFYAFLNKAGIIFKRYGRENISEEQTNHLKTLLQPKINLETPGSDFSPMVSGAVTGAAAGAALGSVIPVIGTVVGGFFGALAGAGLVGKNKLTKLLSEAEAEILKHIESAELEIKSKQLEVINILTAKET